MPPMLSVDEPASSRASHILPTVKCSTCSQPVPLAGLAQHICSPPSSPSSSPTIPRSSPTRSPPVGAMMIESPIMHPIRPPALDLAATTTSVTTPTTTAPLAPFPLIATPPPREEDYMPGGASGMAGVGRRAFQAVAHAALFTQHFHTEARRVNPPQYLNINSSVGISGRGTPPLSPNSTLSSSRSHSPLTPSLYQPPLTPASPITPTSTTPVTSTFRANSNPTPLSPIDHVMSTARLPFFQQKYKNATPSSSPTNGTFTNGSRTPRAGVGAIEPPSPSDYDSDDGLAYDRDDDDDEGLYTNNLASKRDNNNDRSRERDREKERQQEQDRDDRLRVRDRERERSRSREPNHASRTRERRDGDEQRESVSSRSVYSSATTTRRDDLGSSPPHRSRAISNTRVGASESLGSGSSASTSRSASARTPRTKDRSREKVRICLRCELKIENARWVKMDDGKGVLCERCWKNMYLPKCRRCDKHIETAAVYSSDGQLKGKYHRDCFTCATCDKPFPDKSFYVFEGQPYCQFHYAELNDSLCSRRKCGKPIEGSCAIAYGGEKYHPSCLRCGQMGCDMRLGSEYWEVDGKMLCERHGARYAGESSGSEYEDEEREREREGERERRAREAISGKARKRATRLINLDGGRGY